MEMLGRYAQLTALSNKNAGSCRWCFAVLNGREYFIKEFLSPKYPENDTMSTPERIQRKIEECAKFEQYKTWAYSAINDHSDGNAVRVEDFFRVGTKYYMAMPRIQDTQMSVEQIAEQPLEVRERLCRVVAHAFSGIHAGGFVHSDVKPSNVMIIHSWSNTLTAKVIDYDAGFFETDPPARPEEIAGDQLYFSPEAFLMLLGEEAAPLTCKLDVFALGVLFHQYYTGHLPEYDRERYTCAGEAVAMGDTVTVSQDLPEYARQLLQAMLSLEPDQRPTSLRVFEALRDKAQLRHPRNEGEEQPLPAPVLACAKCGNPMDPEDVFCGFCGTPANMPKPGKWEKEPMNVFVGDAPAKPGWQTMGDL